MRRGREPEQHATSPREHHGTIPTQRTDTGAPAEQRDVMAADQPPTQQHDWLTPLQVATLLDATEATVLHKIRSDYLPAVLAGSTWWIRADHLRLIEGIDA